MKRLTGLAGLLTVFFLSAPAHAGFTESLPKSTFLVEGTYIMSSISNAWDNDGNLGPIIDEIERYEPGGSLQGIIKPQVEANFGILLTTVQYGVTDSLSLALGIPVFIYSDVNPNLEWVEGDYQWLLGDTYSEEQFWEWALSMGQPKPGNWTGNQGRLADIIIGFRYRFTDRFKWFEKHGLAAAYTMMGSLPTGTATAAEEIISVGTTSWNLHFQGELAMHLSVDKSFKKYLDNRVTIGLDFFYEIFFRHEYTTPTGEKNPLLLNLRPYVGDTYTIDPGDFLGFSAQIDLVPWKGPARATWLTKGSLEAAEKLPPLVTISLRYTYIYMGQTDWGSNSAIWEWEVEKYWRPGYKNILQGMLTISLLRLGIPLQPFVSYRNQSWLPGKNFRAASVLATGLRIPLKFW